MQQVEQVQSQRHWRELCCKCDCSQKMLNSLNDSAVAQGLALECSASHLQRWL